MLLLLYKSASGNPAITVGATEAADTASFTVRSRHRITVGATEAADVANFAANVASTASTVTVGATEAPDVASVLLNNPSAIVPRKKGAAGPEADFRRRRAEVVVNGRVREVATTEDARRIIAAHVEKAKQKAKVIARREPDALPLPPTIEVNYASESLARMVEEANARIEQMYAQAFARAIARNQEDEDEIAVLLLH